LRDECLNRELFGSLLEAQIILESWRVGYKAVRRTVRLDIEHQTNTLRHRRTNLMGLRAPKPRAARSGTRSGELINAIRSQTNKNQNSNETAELQL
jgi:hypothetical protein